MDKFDQAIIDALVANSRRSIASIGEDIGLSRTAVNDRIQRLKDSGVILRYTIDVSRGDETKVAVYFQLTFRPFDAKSIAPYLQGISEITRAHTLCGDTDLIVYIEAESMTRVSQIRELLAALPDLDKLQTFSVLDTLI
ncbi:Lrp/AsnC family transcriptional regulator [Moritella sp.]|uniref:Lrp/AsnC family transcriptional regulator n=1 Tax=Moritella sp. TaxID=78556 RepID=UPI001D99D922|nr:Lrp/AsnC family transcriptional regulator [Moritella sp.]MCJ8348602.1 Lrp/AsnC family transcriptional regulator [Moritella sp.]NQZ42560.1 Lrp/AsnC family transcriptional regulator [Moritella sp.]